jgi:Na+/H+ antiporter NhaD/arsenite permease-like protein
MKVSDKQQYLIMMGMTFFLSALLDNIAVTIAMLQIARRFFKDKNLLIAAASIVIAANAGGAWSPIGDVTTILLWLADKFTAFEVITYAFLPSFALFLTSTGLLYRQLNDEDFAEKEEPKVAKVSLSEKVVIGTAVISFTFPLFMNLVGLPPYIGLLLGLGLTWMIIEFAKQKSRKEHRSHLTANIEKLVQMVDISSIKFIIGILLSVSALSAIGVLTVVSSVAIGEAPSQGTLLLVNIMIGIFSSIIDNASLVAVAIDIIPTTDPIVWSLLAITAGTGGSIFVIASAAGVVASGTIKQLTFANYFKVATVPALAGFVVGVLVWMLQHMVF